MSKASNKSDETLLSTKELSIKINLKPQYVRDIARLGLIPSYKVGTSWRFSLKAVKKKLEQNAAIAVERSLNATSIDE